LGEAKTKALLLTLQNQKAIRFHERLFCFVGVTGLLA
jgi:hypothetical protein